MIAYLEYLSENGGVPVVVGVVIIGLFVIMQVVGELLEFKGKVVPEFMKIRKFFSRRRLENEEREQTLKEVRQLLGEVNAHYSVDNITKRDGWMKWVNDRAEVYDNSIVEITKNLTDATKALTENTKMTEEMFIQNSRDRIIDFSSRVSDESAMVSREEFNRIFKVYEKYEKFLEERGLTNGEIDIVYRVIRDAYEYRIREHCFLEDIRGY